MEAGLTPHCDLLDALREAVGSDAVIVDDAVLAGMASDLYAEGPLPVVVIRPDISTALAAAVAATNSRGCSVVPRGGERVLPRVRIQGHIAATRQSSSRKIVE